ncbi:hypothetical protein KPH14_002661 [Odynerus spinipes]|uniref:Uncharacterized protein n=1 Tax=Odynerus spinipes TaxID=1348599 RepID=A0AAD9VM30_9HYME|nr:hypothetical protein KPH14_002661 [Odynerus spinipes]
MLEYPVLWHFFCSIWYQMSFKNVSVHDTVHRTFDSCKGTNSFSREGSPHHDVPPPYFRVGVWYLTSCLVPTGRRT